LSETADLTFSARNRAPTCANQCAYPWQQMIIDLTGEVVPCCFWSGYGNFGKPLGNTNEQSLAEIWNGEGYRELRQRLTRGSLDDHPCGNCTAYRWANGQFPRFGWPAGFAPEQGCCFSGPIPEKFWEQAEQSRTPILLLENGVPLPYPDSPHDEIRRHGRGRYSVWKGWLYFSAPDNSDPCSNGRRYELRCGDHFASLDNLHRRSKSGQNLVRAYEEYLNGAAVLSAKPSMISLISTADCNIDCPACSQNMVRLTRVQHRPETVPDVLDHLPYLQQLIWHGGEPYLIARFRKLIDEYQSEDNPNLAFGFTSNGTMITAAEAKKLTKFPRINASISVDSFEPATFERIRAGARFDRVMANLLGLLELHDAPRRVFSVGMIICKSNFAELARNLRVAIDHDIGLNLSPVLLYPLTEQINVFADFVRETVGWEAALKEARSIVEGAKARNRRAIRRVDPSGMIEELQRIYEGERRRYGDVVTFRVEVVDAHRTLPQLPRAGIVVRRRGCSSSDNLCYVELNQGAGVYELQVPRTDLRAVLYASFIFDLLEPFEYGDHTVLLDIRSGAGQVASMRLPRFVPLTRPRNAHYVHYGESTPEGLYVRDPQQIHEAYSHLRRDEAIRGHGLLPSPSPAHLPVFNGSRAKWRAYAREVRDYARLIVDRIRAG
jgi:radical SAM protein with 4Fe4S-binding SPASM domain